MHHRSWNPADRLTARQALAHAYFRSFLVLNVLYNPLYFYIYMCVCV